VPTRRENARGAARAAVPLKILMQASVMRA
jgi:hypothetical protein